MLYLTLQRICVTVDVSLDVDICVTVCVFLVDEVCVKRLTVDVCATFGVLLDIEVLCDSWRSARRSDFV